MTESLDDLLAFAQRLADASGDVIRPWFRAPLDVLDKSDAGAGYDPVTIADKEAEAVIRRMIKAEHPTHGVLGEEHGHEAGSGYTWVIDPIDGTRAFICGMPQWGTLIALNDGERPVLGVLDQPITEERWTGRPGSAEIVTRAGTRRLSTRACEGLGSAVLTTTHPSAHFTDDEREAFDTLARSVKMTRFGGDCYAYGLLAMGFIDLVVEAGLKPWDVQALIPIVEGAGGVITSWDGGDAQHGGRVVAAGDKRLHAAALEVLRAVP